MHAPRCHHHPTAIIIKSQKTEGCRVLSVLEGLTFVLTCCVHPVCWRFVRPLWGSVEIAQSCRRTNCTRHASKKIRPSKRLGLYRNESNRKIPPQQLGLRSAWVHTRRSAGKLYCGPVEHDLSFVLGWLQVYTCDCSCGCGCSCKQNSKPVFQAAFSPSARSLAWTLPCCSQKALP